MSFWAISCVSGKRYYQVPRQSFHISMAALEPRERAQIPPNKQVSLMVEHNDKEFLLCTLEYNRVMQVSLDLNFLADEPANFYLCGEGTVHLTGYETNKQKKGNGVQEKKAVKKVMGADMSDADNDYDPSFDLSDFTAFESRVTRGQKLTFEDIDDDDDEDEEDDPDFVANSENEDDDSSSSSDATDEEDSIDEKESSDEDEAEDQSKMKEKNKRKLSSETPSTSKKRKSESEAPKSKVTDDEESSSSSEESDKDLSFSTAGRTPIPARKAAIKALASNNDVETSGKAKNKTPMKSNENGFKDSVFHHKLPCGTEYQDMRVGNGPIAVRGKTLHLYYVGKLENNTEFDSVQPGGSKKGKPFSFKLGQGQVIPGWDSGLEGMRVGGSRMLKVPPKMAYGKNKCGIIPSNSTLFFNVVLKAVS